MHIYKITNIVNNKIYIGQTTKSINSSYLGSGTIIIKAVKKYGKDSFIKEVLEVLEDLCELSEREIYWIEYYNSTDRNIGYNISSGGNGGNLGEIVNKKLSDISKESGRLIGNKLRSGVPPINKGVAMSEEQKDKLRKPKTDEHKRKLSEVRIGKHTKPIICLNNNEIYESIKEAANSLNLTGPNIIKVLKGGAKKTKGYIFEYYYPPIIEDIKNDLGD